MRGWGPCVGEGAAVDCRRCSQLVTACRATRRNRLLCDPLGEIGAMSRWKRVVR